MAAKKSRAEKAVLSRQDITQRRKAIQEQRMKTGGAGGRALTGTFLLAGSVLTLLSVATFDVQDRIGPGFRNSVGPVGHLIAEAFRGLLGVCAYVPPVAGLYAAAIVLVGSRERRRWPQMLSLLLLVLSGAVLAQLVFQGEPGWAHAPGGLVGSSLGGVLSGLFSTVGTVILVSSVCIAAFIVGTQYAFLKLCALLWGVAVAVGRRVAAAAAALWERQREAWAERKEAAARARLEDAAFLAQLEADEEELEDAERALAEAEAAAEEAARQARLAEERQAARGKKGAGKELAAPARGRLALPASAKQATVPEEDARETQGPVALPPGADPAWVGSFGTFATARPTPLAAEAAPESPRKRERRTPSIVTAPEAPASRAVAHEQGHGDGPSHLPSPRGDGTSSPLPPGEGQGEGNVVAGSAAQEKSQDRTPLIVAPKAPPRPTKKAQEQFQFADGRTAFSLPPLDVLECETKGRSTLDQDAFLATAEKLRAKLADFGIQGEVVEIRPGPVVTMYEFVPGPGIKVSKIASLADDLAMAMEAMRVRIVAPIPGKGVVGIEVPNRDRETVYLKEIAEQDAFNKSSSRLAMCVGKDIEGMPYVFDLAKAPHLLIAGTTGSGKSVAVNSMIMSILLKATPEEVRFIMVDPKMLELSVYEGIPHLLLPVVTDPKKAALALRWAVEEMERRYTVMSAAGVRNIAGYNKMVEGLPKDAGAALRARSARTAVVNAPSSPPKKVVVVDVGAPEEAAERASEDGLGVPVPKEPLEDFREPVVDGADAELDAAVDAALEGAEPAPGFEAASEETPEPPRKLPYIVVIIDELADLMMVASREVETYVARLAQMARAAGIHLMVATQRPSTDVVTGVIKANFPTRISFMLRSKPDSMTILGTIGAEALLGMGDMLIMPPTSAHLQRVHGAFVSEAEIKKAVDHLKAQGKPVYDESILKPREEESGGGGEEDELADGLYDQALAAVADMRQVSISMLQRKMRIGYNRAARMIERMERDGVVGPADGAKPREVLIRPVGEMPGA
ncbi:MAG: DNA translocase FtsK 4TM domain-containing protein [Myxococcaceae bacterium]|nr:DNA translocase FtsK 4TM domain-containing protein [Myxococcaceae bacterium]